MVVSKISAVRPKAESVLGITNGARDMLSTPPGDHHLAVIGLDHPRGDVDGVEAGGTQTIDRRAGHRIGKSREQHGHARDIAVVFARLIGRAEVYVVDELRINACPFDELANDQRRQIVGAHCA